MTEPYSSLSTLTWAGSPNSGTFNTKKFEDIKGILTLAWLVKKVFYTEQNISSYDSYDDDIRNMLQRPIRETRPGGYKEMSSILADKYRSSFYEPKCGGGGSSVVSANEYSCTQEPK
jgi:hypothetical protein